MKELAIIICNYNKADYVVKCIRSVLESEYQDFDLYVVDNASTDDSVAAIRKNFPDRVTILQNAENLGGSGGFNRGLREVQDKAYDYVLCLDNDVQVTKTAVGQLRDFLAAHPQVGMAGSKVYHLQMPEYVQQMGLKIHFDTFSAETLYADVKDSEEIPPVVYCDTVAACSVMLPMKVLRQVGGMPEDNFIYWDDMEWGYRVKLAGYQVAAVGASRVFHEMSANVRRETTFSTYYLWRNQLHFFMKYTPANLRERMCFVMLSSVFDAMYEKLYREEHNVAATLQYAFFDALMGVRGKAEDCKILENDSSDERVREALTPYTKICVQDEAGIGLQEALASFLPQLSFVEESQAQKIVKSCDRIMGLTDVAPDVFYMDSQWNIAAGQEDMQTIQNYGYSLQLFLYMHQNVFYAQSSKIYDSFFDTFL